MLVRSGDAVVMAGESRYSYHGVPAVLPHGLSLSLGLGQGLDQGPGGPLSCAACCDVCRCPARAEGSGDEGGEGADGLGHVRRYLSHGRVNINCRRVARADGVWEADRCGSGAAAGAAAAAAGR